MSFFFKKSSLRRANVSLKAQLDTFRGYSAELAPPHIVDEKQHFLSKTKAALQNAISLIETAKSELLAVLAEIEHELSEAKKAERKEILEDFQAIETEIPFDATLIETDALLSALKTRLSEVSHDLILTGSDIRDEDREKDRSRLALAQTNSQEEKHKIPESDSIFQSKTLQSLDYQFQKQNTVNGEQCEIAINESQAATRTTLKPPAVTIPHFSGKVEEFHEFWAIFETLVHTNPSLTDMEKMIVLKESLIGKASIAIKGIKMVPQNYTWMVETITRKYGNVTTARANVIQRLSKIQPAKENTCEHVFDELRSLVNEMVSSGYNVTDTKDPMWIEAIIQKLPHHIVEEFLRENKDGESYTVGETLDKLEGIIMRYQYITRRLGVRETEQKQSPHSQPQKGNRAYENTELCNFCGRFNHKAFQCRTVQDAGARRKIVMEKNLCWKCFAPTHRSYECSRPNCKRCGRLHDQTLCFQKPSESQPERNHARKEPRVNSSDSRPGATNATVQYDSDANSMPTLPTSHTVNTSAIHQNDYRDPEQIVLMTAEGSVWNYQTDSYEKALFFFDTGAQLSLIEEKSAEHLALPVLQTEQCTLSGISGISETFFTHHVELKIQTAHAKELRFCLRTKPTLTKGFPSVRLLDADVQFMEENCIYLANSRLSGERQTPQILVGIDLYNVFIPENTPPVQMPSGLRVAKTVFGFAAYGRGIGGPHSSCEDITRACNTVVSEATTDAEMVKTMFELEGLGISTKEGINEEATFAYLSKYAKSIEYDNNSVTAPLPLKENIKDLADNRNMALKRLIAQVKHLNAFPERKKWYVKIIEQYLADDIIEEVKEPVGQSVGTYYMPHSGVWKEHKPTPLRIVFDASSHQRGQLSLNDVLYTGASFVNKIHDILVASREMPIILIADIQAAFTQIRGHEPHRDLCRFLWLKDPEKPPIHSNLVEYRWKRLPFGTKASPSVLNMVISAYLSRIDNVLANEIQKYLYVDNVLMTASTTDEAIKKYRESKALFSALGMNLRAFLSNSAVVNSHIGEEDRAPCGPTKLLGVAYDHSSDSFLFDTKPQRRPMTKRDLLSQLHSVYDPIGFSAPLFIKQKQLMRMVLEETPEWNSQIEHGVIQEWQAINREIGEVHIEIPRHFVRSRTHDRQNSLWVFADASHQAMAVCAYMVEYNFNEVSNLISGKTKLAPKKRPLSIPRLELLAILIALRLAESISTALQTGLSSINIVSDSLIALSWIRTSRKLPLFILNQRDRIRSILNRLTAFGYELHLLHVPGEKNPADAGTRGVTGAQLDYTDWVKGPQWLLDSTQRESLISIESIDTVPNEHDEELQDEVVLAETVAEGKTESWELLQLRRYSSFSKALRVLALVGKFLKLLVNRVYHSRNKTIAVNIISKYSADTQITAHDMNHAESILLKIEHEGIDIDDLRSKHRDKTIFRDGSGVIRCKSRLQNANLHYDTQNPIYVASNSEVMRLILSDLHRNNGHCGRNHLLALARQRFWLSRPSRSVRSILNKCAICRRAQSHPFGTPPMAPLPSDRVTRAKPFQNTGCDFMGPFALKDNSKVYICLYSCLTTRAIHLELVESLFAGAFLNSFVRFVSRRGVPTLVRTDCGSNFKLGQKVIDLLFTEDESTGISTMGYCANQRISWVFNPPGAPWMGEPGSD